MGSEEKVKIQSEIRTWLDYNILGFGEVVTTLSGDFTEDDGGGDIEVTVQFAGETLTKYAWADYPSYVVPDEVCDVATLCFSEIYLSKGPKITPAELIRVSDAISDIYLSIASSDWKEQAPQ